jgi:GT2 family glycosyltransferase
MSGETLDLSIIVVSYNTKTVTLRCLEAIFADLPRLSNEVIVVDNASTDGSADAIRQSYPSVRVVSNSQNIGFAAGNNLGMKNAVGRCFLLINSDAFVQPGAVKAMMDFLAANSDVALVGPRILNADGSLQRSCFRFPSPGRAWVENLWISAPFGPDSVLGDYRRWPHDREQEVDWVIGACFMVRREVYQQIGGFDERFFMYAEETDWQLRMRQAGWKIGFTPLARVIHLGGASGAAEKPKINRHFFDSLDYYEVKHHGIVGLILLRAAMIIGSAPRMIGWSILFACSPTRRATAKAKMRLLSWLLVRQLTHWRLTA